MSLTCIITTINGACLHYKRSTYTHTYIYTQMHTYLHTHIHTYNLDQTTSNVTAKSNTNLSR